MKATERFKFLSETDGRMRALGFCRLPESSAYGWVCPTNFPGADLFVNIDLGPSSKLPNIFCRFERDNSAERCRFWDITYTLPEVNPYSGKANLLLVEPERAWETIEAHLRRLTTADPAPITFRALKVGHWYRIVFSDPNNPVLDLYLCRDGNPGNFLSHYPSSDSTNSHIVTKPTLARAVAYGRALGFFYEEPKPAKKPRRSAR